MQGFFCFSMVLCRRLRLTGEPGSGSRGKKNKERLISISLTNDRYLVEVMLMFFSQEELEQERPFQELQSVVPAQSEEYGDFIVRYVHHMPSPLEEIPGASLHPVSEVYAVLYVPLAQIPPLEINSDSYNSIPKCFTYMDLNALGASGITRLHNHPYLGLRGKGTAVAVIDSGIDYQNPVFSSPSGTRIACIWDQSLPGDGDGMAPYGQVYMKQDIDQAMEQENPLVVVPSVDTNGHGTMLAAAAAGNLVPEENFSGAAPEASLIVIKLKPAKKYLKDFYQLSQAEDVFQEDDIMMGMAFAMKCARALGMPLSICLGLGTSQGAHLGKSPLSQYVDYSAGFAQVSVSVAAGNEGASRHHFAGALGNRRGEAVAELRVGPGEEGFTMEFWGEPPEIYILSIQSPTGETLEISSFLGTVTQELSFVFVETKIYVNYVSIERQTGNTLVFFRFVSTASGIWKIFVRGRENQDVNFHIWLPVEGLISGETYFLESSLCTTVTSPGDSLESMTVTAYQYRDNSIYLYASRGFMPNGMVVPQLAAPGVGIRIPLLNGTYGEASGTSLAAAQTAGAAALMFEWAIIRKNQPNFTGTSVKNYLQRGARREDNYPYPNKEWGYGRVDLYHTFELLT